MDLQAEKQDLIQWLSGVEDLRKVKLFRTLRSALEKESATELTRAEKSAIDKGLQSINEGKTKSYEEAMELTKKEFPNLFQ